MSRSELTDRFPSRQRVVDPFDDRAVNPVDHRASASEGIA
ncbi:hypothetical protein DM2_185 [Halorubrum sp. DM2]|nr:hypothetical protein DM2_185 [Halorubrum sp. DM2]